MSEAVATQEISVLSKRVDELAAALAAREKVIANKNKQIDYLVRMLFGRKSEKINPDQLGLAFEALESCTLNGFTNPFVKEAKDVETPDQGEVKAEAEKAKKPGHGRRKLPENLPRIEKHVHPPEAELLCACCGKRKKEIGVELTEQLNYEPAVFSVNVTIRHKYACEETCLTGVTTPALPETPIHKGMPAPGLLAQVVVSKYADHLPLNRLSGIFQRSGLDISRSTLCGWVDAVSSLLLPIVDYLKVAILASKYVQTDDTGILVLDKHAKGGSRKGALWIYRSIFGDVVFVYTPTRAGAGPAEFLKGFIGKLQADAYTGYDKLFLSGEIVEVGCMAHTRQKFFESMDSSPLDASKVMAIVRLLYKVEADAKERALSPQEVKALRQEKSVSLLKSMKTVLDGLLVTSLPSSPLGKAVRYAVNHWVALTRYADDGHLDIDNNAVERRIRAVAIGRNNWIFAGSDEGAARGAAIYSIIASCKEAGVEPFEYLRDDIGRIPSHPKDRIHELTPRGWKAARATVATPSATPATAAVS